MTNIKPHEDWLTPDELAQRMGRSPRWVKEQMAAGELPSVKVGGTRYWTPGCMSELEARHLAAKTASEGWGRKTKRGAA